MHFNVDIAALDAIIEEAEATRCPINTKGLKKKDTTTLGKICYQSNRELLQNFFRSRAKCFAFLVFYCNQ